MHANGTGNAVKGRTPFMERQNFFPNVRPLTLITPECLRLNITDDVILIRFFKVRTRDSNFCELKKYESNTVESMNIETTDNEVSEISTLLTLEHAERNSNRTTHPRFQYNLRPIRHHHFRNSQSTLPNLVSAALSRKAFDF